MVPSCIIKEQTGKTKQEGHNATILFFSFQHATCVRKTVDKSQWDHTNPHQQKHRVETVTRQTEDHQRPTGCVQPLCWSITTSHQIVAVGCHGAIPALGDTCDVLVVACGNDHIASSTRRTMRDPGWPHACIFLGWSKPIASLDVWRDVGSASMAHNPLLLDKPPSSPSSHIPLSFLVVARSPHVEVVRDGVRRTRVVLSRLSS